VHYIAPTIAPDTAAARICCCVTLCDVSAVWLQLLGCRGSLAEREPGQMFHTAARICQVPQHAE